MEELGIAITIIDLISSFFSFALSVATYVLTSWGFYTIAQRRGIDKPWLAWIPVANVWILGCISDQYRYVAKGENKSKRKVLIGLSIASAVCAIVFIVLLIIAMVDIAGMAMGNMGSAAVASAALSSMGGAFLMLIPIAGISIANTIVYYIALYDVYTSCDPKNSVVYLILSIFVSITAPFFVFFNRKKDFGMPPRRPDPMQYMPPQQPNWQNPQQGAYQQPQPNAYYQPQQPGWQNPQPNWQQPQQPQSNWQPPQQNAEPNNSGNPENF